MKIATVSSEILRKLKSMSLGVSKGEAEGHIREYMDNLIAMGYSREWCQEVLKSAMIGYCRVLKKGSEGKGLRNKTGKCTQLKRRVMKLVGTSEWYKLRDTEGEDDEVERDGERPRKSCRNKRDNKYVEG